MRINQIGTALGMLLPVRKTYTVTPNSSSVNEGVTLPVTVTTKYVPNGTLYWTINNITTSTADFVASSGSFTLTSGSGSFNITTTADATTEGNETFTVSISNTYSI